MADLFSTDPVKPKPIWMILCPPWIVSRPLRDSETVRESSCGPRTASCGALLVAFLVTVLVRRNGSYWTWLDGWGVDCFEVLVSALCIARGLLKRPGRAVALTLGLGLLAWSVGDIFLTIESLGGATPPNPSLADLFYLLFYPLTYVAVVLLMRREIKRISPPSWLDGIIAGLGSATLCAAFAFHSIEHTAGGSALGVATNLAYPIGDVLLLGLIVAATALLSGRGKGPWALMATGIALNVVGDTSNLFGSSFGGGRVGSTFNAIAWPAAILLMSMSVWLRPRSTTPLVAERTSGFLLPGYRYGIGTRGPARGDVPPDRPRGDRARYGHLARGGDPPDALGNGPSQDHRTTAPRGRHGRANRARKQAQVAQRVRELVRQTGVCSIFEPERRVPVRRPRSLQGDQRLLRALGGRPIAPAARPASHLRGEELRRRGALRRRRVRGSC